MLVVPDTIWHKFNSIDKFLSRVSPATNGRVSRSAKSKGEPASRLGRSLAFPMKKSSQHANNQNACNANPVSKFHL